MNENNETHHQSTDSTARSAHLETTMKDLLSLGQLWASYGLSAGKHALEASARTQETLARLLGELAAHLDRNREEPTS